MFWVYILTNTPGGVLYIGITRNLGRRMEHYRTNATSGFVTRYRLFRLVLAEPYPTALEAIKREKQLKNWHRDWKINLIESANPEWNDLLPHIHMA